MEKVDWPGIYRPLAPAGSVTSGTVLRRVPGLSRSRLRRWTAAGIVVPTAVGTGHRKWLAFSEDDIDLIRRVLSLMDHHGYTLKGAVAAAKRLRELRKEQAQGKQAIELPEWVQDTLNEAKGQGQAPDDSWLEG